MLTVDDGLLSVGQLVVVAVDEDQVDDLLELVVGGVERLEPEKQQSLSKAQCAQDFCIKCK